MKISAWTIFVVSQHSVRIISVVWLYVNNLSLNIKAHLWYSHKNTHPCCSQYWSSTISEVSITKHIRVYVDSHLKWKKPIDNTADKLSCGIGLVAKECKLFNSEAVIKYSHIWHSCTGRALLHWRKECGQLWVQLASAVQAPYTV